MPFHYAHNKLEGMRIVRISLADKKNALITEDGSLYVWGLFP